MIVCAGKKFVGEGRPCKTTCSWERKVYVLVHRNDPLSPVYEDKRESGEGPLRVLHRNLLLPCNDVQIENPVLP